MKRASMMVSVIALFICSLASSSAWAQLPANQGVLELSTAWKHWVGQQPSTAGAALNIAAQFVNDTGNNSSGPTMHDIDDAERLRLIKYWGTWRPAAPKGRKGNGPNAQSLSYTDNSGNY